MKTADLRVGTVYAHERSVELRSPHPALLLSTEVHHIPRLGAGETGPRYAKGEGVRFNSRGAKGLPVLMLHSPYDSAEVEGPKALGVIDLDKALTEGRVEIGESKYNVALVAPRTLHGEFTPIKTRLLAARERARQERTAQQAADAEVTERQHALLDRLVEAEVLTQEQADSRKRRAEYAISLSLTEVEALLPRLKGT